jgi:hypothetical protein
MSKNRGVVYIKPGVVEVRDIPDPINFSFWHKADTLNALTHVRFWGQSGHP